MNTMYFAPRAITVDGIGAISFATIQVGSSGNDVIAWQKIIGVTADGKFGPQTKAATQKWQADHGLTADGIVGPQTWGAAASLGVTSMTDTHRGLMIAGGAAAAGAAAWWWFKKHKHKRAA